ncbi:hypothetical protein [uncultured Psychroserpens sp.]|uniref:hypothetical protein n=1 Tax=uncultured Psychroserpens sp. TaxID=255436 RepID=UPI00261FEC56|nr:hypothetical protein [uncultured Psychroserpens sp.]
MKTLKITFLLLAVVLLTISGQSSDSVEIVEVEKSDSTNVNLMAHCKGKLKMPGTGTSGL